MPILVWFLLAILIFGIVLGIFEETYFESKKKERVLKSVSVVVLLVFTAMTLLGFAMYAPMDYESDKFYVSSEEISNIEIYSIEGSMGIQGRFVLGSGSIEGKQIYEYYYYSDGGYYRDYIYSKNVKIVMDDTEVPRIYKVVKEYRFKWFLFHSGKGNAREITETIIYLPEGSIIENYTLN